MNKDVHNKEVLNISPIFPSSAVSLRLQAKENKLMVITRNTSDTLHQMLTAESSLLPKHMGLMRLDG